MLLRQDAAITSQMMDVGTVASESDPENPSSRSTARHRSQSPPSKQPRDVKAKMSHLQKKYSASGKKDARSFIEHLDNMAAEYKYANRSPDPSLLTRDDVG
jgi:ubiquitin C-terminal hydrolase